MLLANSNLLDDAKLLIRNKKIKELLAFFPMVDNANDTEKITVYRETIDNKKFRHTYDTLVPRERIDKVLIWMQAFMSGYLRDPSPDFHREIIALLFSPKNEYFAAPRGFSKTTLVQGIINFSCAHKLEKFIVLVEKNFTEACEVLDAVRDEFSNNERILKFYGDLTAGKNSELERVVKERDAQGDFFINGVRLRAKGFNQPIRGLKSREWRPSLIINDDVESDEHIENIEQRAKYESNYNKGIIPAVDVEGRIKMVGTILHLDSLLSRKIRQHNGKVWRAFYDESRFEWSDILSNIEIHNTKKIKLLWRERWSYPRLMEKKRNMIGKGMSTNAFSQEFLNDPAGDEDRKFKASWLWNPTRRILMSDLLKTGKIFNGYCAIDPAESTKEGSDYTGCVVHLIDPNHNRYRVHVSRTRRDIKGVIDLIFEIWQEWQPFGLTTIGIEKKAFADQVEPLLREAKLKREIYPNVVELRPRGRQKESRILGNLQGRYEMGNIWTVGDQVSGEFVPVGDTEMLLAELHTFPASETDDLSDSESYVCEMSSIPGKQQESPEALKKKDEWDSLFGEAKTLEQSEHGANSIDDPWI